MELSVFRCFFYGFWISAPLVFLVGMYLAIRRSMRLIVDEETN